MPKILTSRVTWDVDGTDYVATHTLAPDVTVDELHEYFPATRCTHSHDCCGRYYARRAEITVLSDRIQVVQRHVCNI